MSIKTQDHLAAIALKKKILSAPKTGFVCTDCLRTRDKKDKATNQGICRACWARKKRAEYRANKYGKECIKCHTVSTHFSGENNICYDCRTEARKHGRTMFKQHLGDKLVLLWKAGFSYDKAIESIRLARTFKYGK